MAWQGVKINAIFGSERGVLASLSFPIWVVGGGRMYVICIADAGAGIEADGNGEKE